MRRFLPIALLPLSSLLLAACDGYAAFTVVNQSSFALTARLLEEPCDESSLNKRDVLGEDRVPAHGILEYSDVLAGEPSNGRCVQVYTGDGDLVLAGKYQESASYVVGADPEVIGHVETTDMLPRQGLLHRQEEWLSDYPVEFLFVWGSLLFLLAFVVSVIGAVALGILMAVRTLLSPTRDRGS